MSCKRDEWCSASKIKKKKENLFSGEVSNFNILAELWRNADRHFHKTSFNTPLSLEKESQRTARQRQKNCRQTLIEVVEITLVSMTQHFLVFSFSFYYFGLSYRCLYSTHLYATNPRTTGVVAVVWIDGQDEGIYETYWRNVMKLSRLWAGNNRRLRAVINRCFNLSRSCTAIKREKRKEEQWEKERGSYHLICCRGQPQSKAAKKWPLNQHRPIKSSSELRSPSTQITI